MTDASSLVVPADYQRVTGDTTTAVPQVTAALDEALGLVQDEIGRTLVFGTYRETLLVYKNGCVYPTATPISTVVAPNVDAVSIQGAAIYLGYWNPAPAVTYGEFNAGVPPQSTVTYSGGFTADTLPAKLLRAICRVAFNSCHPAPLVGVPAGATSVHVGDVGYEGASLRTLDPLDDGVKKDLRGFRNQQFRGWQISVASA